jgi:DNA invertase Pin-like site-specific DNA recombinase
MRRCLPFLSVLPLLLLTACAEHDPVRRFTSDQVSTKPIDTSTAAGKCFLDMLGVFAEFETNLRRERQMEGIAKAKANHVYKGRKASIDGEELRRLVAEGLTPTQIAGRLKIARQSVYRVLKGAA